MREREREREREEKRVYNSLLLSVAGDYTNANCCLNLAAGNHVVTRLQRKKFPGV